MIGRNKQPSRIEQSRQARRPRVVRSNIGSNSIRSNKTTQKSKTKSYKAVRFAGLMIVFGLLFWSGYTGSVKVIAEGSDEMPVSVGQSVKGYFAGINSWWWFVSKDDAIASIKKSNAYISDVGISRSPLKRDIVVKVELRRPLIRVNANKQRYLIANDGVVLDASEEGKELPLVYDESSDVTTLEAGKPYLPSQTVASINSINTELGSQGIKIKDFSLTDNTREVRVFLKDVKYYIKFATDTDIKAQIKDFNLVKSKNKLNSASEYVDVRFSGKVYIK